MALDTGMLRTAVLLTNGERSIGTGFLVTVSRDGPGTRPRGFLVTAHHVVHHEPTVFAEISNALSNGDVYPAIKVTDWTQPVTGVDVAIAPR
jgi:hypothetical protein